MNRLDLAVSGPGTLLTFSEAAIYFDNRLHGKYDDSASVDKLYSILEKSAEDARKEQFHIGTYEWTNALGNTIAELFGIKRGQKYPWKDVIAGVELIAEQFQDYSNVADERTEFLRNICVKLSNNLLSEKANHGSPYHKRFAA